MLFCPDLEKKNSPNKDMYFQHSFHGFLSTPEDCKDSKQEILNKH